MQLSDLVIDWKKTVGENLSAVEIKEIYQYDSNNKKTSNILGYGVVVIAPKLKFDKITVKVLCKEKPFELEDGDLVPVYFENINGKAYLDYRSNEVRFSLSAENVFVIEE